MWEENQIGGYEQNNEQPGPLQNLLKINQNIGDTILKGGAKVLETYDRVEQEVLPFRKPAIEKGSEWIDNNLTSLLKNVGVKESWAEKSGDVAGVTTNILGEVFTPGLEEATAATLTAGAALTPIPGDEVLGALGTTGLYGKGVITRGIEQANKLPDYGRLISGIFDGRWTMRNGKRTLVTPEGVEINANNLNPNIMQSTTKGGGSLFKGDSVKVNDFISRGNLYAQGELNKGRKNSLLKGWNNKITDDNGVDFMLVRGRNNKFNLRQVHEVELDLLKKSGYTGTAKEMNKIRSEINRALGNRPGTRYWDILSEGDKDTYIEHLVAKGQHWFWELPHSQRSWSPPSRNTAFNLRIVNNQRYKSLKDSIEKIVYPRNYINPEKALSYTKDGIPVYKGKLKPNLGSRLIIHVEDPLTTTTNLAAKDKKLLGNLTIRRANNGEVIGKFGDYLDAIYSPTFEDGLRQSGLLKTGESIHDWRTNFLTEKFDFIVSEAPLLNQRAEKIAYKYAHLGDPKKIMAAAKSAVIDKALIDDLTAFKANFPWADIPPGLLDHYRRNLGL
jgi:hypothetical protein